MFRGNYRFGTPYGGTYREPDVYPTASSHDTSSDSNASTRPSRSDMSRPPPNSTRIPAPTQNPARTPGPNAEQQRIAQLETMVNQLQARLNQAPDGVRPDPAATPDTLATLLDRLSIKTKTATPTPRVPEAKPVDLMPLEHMKEISKIEETSLQDLKLQIEREEQRQSTNPQDITYLSSLQKRYIDRITDLRSKQDKLRVIERTSTQTTATGLPLPTFTPKPEEYRRPKDAMESRTIQKMVSFKFDPLRKDTNTPSTPFRHCWLTLLEYGEGIYLETEEDYKTLIRKSCSGETLEEFLDIKHLPLVEILEKMSLTLDARTNIEFYRQKVDHFKREKDEDLMQCMLRAIKLLNKLKLDWPEEDRNTLSNERGIAILKQLITPATSKYLQNEEYKSRQIGNHLRLEPLIKLADEYERRNNEAPTKEITTLFQVASLLPKLAPSEIQSQKDQIQYLKAEKSEISKLKEEQENLKEKLQIMETNATNFRSRPKTPDQISKKRLQDLGNKWRSQSKDNYKPKSDTDAEMTDTSEPASSSEKDKPEQPKKDYTNRDYSRPNSSQGYYKQPYNKDYQKPDYDKSKYQSQSYGRENKFLFKPKLVETRDGKHGYNCVPCNSIHDSTLVCMEYLEYKDLTRNVPSPENC